MMKADTEIADGRLLDRYVSRKDDSAFEEIVRRHGSMVMNVCRRMLHDPQIAEDAFQATFLVLVKRAPSLTNAKPLAH